MDNLLTSDKKCLVTGATGFIGGRLIEKLCLDHEGHVKALVRNPKHGINIGRFPIDMYQGDIRDSEKLRSSVEEGDIIFHCAHHFEGTPGDNVEATKNLLNAALAKQAGRIIVLSTADTYESKQEGIIDESTPQKSAAISNYVQSKLAVEDVCDHYFRQYQLPIVIIQPTIVYGPWCKPWTVRIFDQMARGKIQLVNNGTGICNAIYIDDLVNLMIKAALKPTIEGETFIANNATSLTWKAFFNYFENIFGSERTINSSQPDKVSQPMLPSSNLKEQFKRPLSRILPRSFKDAAKNYLSNISSKNRPIPLTKEQARYFAAQATFNVDKAKRDLDFTQSFSYQEGFDQVAYWYKHFYQKG